MKEITIKVPEGITKEQVESYIQTLRSDYIVKLSKEDAKTVYKELAKSNSIKKEVIDFIKTMDYKLYSIVKGSIQMYKQGISTKTMNNNEFDITYEGTKQNIYSYIRNSLEVSKVKCDCLPDFIIKSHINYSDKCPIILDIKELLKRDVDFI